MSRPTSAVSVAALASVIAMTAFVLWTGQVRTEAAGIRSDPDGARERLTDEATKARKPLGLIDL